MRQPIRGVLKGFHPFDNSNAAGLVKFPCIPGSVFRQRKSFTQSWGAYPSTFVTFGSINPVSEKTNSEPNLPQSTLSSHELYCKLCGPVLRSLSPPARDAERVTSDSRISVVQRM